ncbi:PREDICTED: methyl-CpG-binding domain protein 2 [Chrysochloris asiatica]|uniref:Methyl-CpG-binding domain protein 2 n=1 Tax=Chrysochloris asiatica TaxID=185453 RepID=A0A9B0TAI6_CHRAS|nr:PREDICTED: methyl-CpG-binding domain protein 2 [Chrysochloris asiatica]
MKLRTQSSFAALLAPWGLSGDRKGAAGEERVRLGACPRGGGDKMAAQSAWRTEEVRPGPRPGQEGRSARARSMMLARVPRAPRCGRGGSPGFQGLASGSAGPGPRGPRATESGKRMDCPALPPGWKKEEVIRKSGLSAGKSDVYYFSPSGKKFRSKPQLARYLGNTVDLSSFDFRTGKMMPSKLQKNKQRLRNDPLNQNKGKPDLNTTLPIRQTASIFKQPVTKVTNHPNNKVKSDPQRMNEQPRQLFWEKRLQGLSASDVTEQIIKTMELPKGLQGVGPGSNDETLLSAVASALHTSSAPITGQVSAAVEKNPAVWLNTSQPLCKAFIVTDEDIRKQEERVQQVRKKLEEALMADILSRAADTEEMDLEMDGGDEA